jgi:serine/threonine-protein kinase
MHAIRRDPDKRYKSMRDMWHALQNLNEVVPEPYEPDAPRQSTLRQQILLATLVVIALALLVIAIGFAAQMAHHATH